MSETRTPGSRWGSAVEGAAGAVPSGAVPWVLDGALAVGMAGLSLALLADASVQGAAVRLLAMGHTLPLVARRRYPVAVLAAGVATGLAVVLLGYPTVVLGVALLVQVYTVAAYRPRRVSLPSLAAVEAALALAQLLARPGTVDTWVGNSLVVAVFWLLGDIARRWRARAAAFEELAAELQAAREELARKAVTEERLRIARELHDVVAHSMSTIAVQAGVGAHVIETHPREARAALEAIEQASRSTLDELRRLLGVLRRDGEPGGSRAPAPGLADLDALIAKVAEAGLLVRTRVEGTPPRVPASVDLSAYRIVQEALTNVLRHAGPASALVVVRYTGDDVSVEISDDGRAGTSLAAGRPSTAGNGIAGMRERVAAFGGDLEVGPRPGGGFRVAARLPFEAVRR